MIGVASYECECVRGWLAGERKRGLMSWGRVIWWEERGMKYGDEIRKSDEILCFG